MLKQEWKSLIHNKIFLIVIIAVIAIPTIYTTLFLGSMWDPYGNVDKLPVAVVNEDQPVSYEDTDLHVGDSLVEELRKSTALDFHFTDGKKAAKGLKDGTYYMVITIPSDFSSNAATLTDDSPKKMELSYTTNPGTNYIASKMSETAMKELQASVREEVTKTYTRVMFNQLNQVGDGMKEAADGASELADGENRLQEGNDTLTQNLKLLSDSSLTFQNGSQTLTEGLKSYTQGVQEAADGSRKLDQGADALKTGTTTLMANLPSLTTGVSQLADGSNALTFGLNSVQSNSQALADGAAKTDQNLILINQGLNQLQSNTDSLPSSAKVLDQSVQGLLTKSEDLNQAAAKLSQGALTLADETDALHSQLENISGKDHTSSQNLAGQAQQLSQNLASIDSLASHETSGTSTDLSGAHSLLSQMTEQGRTLNTAAANAQAAARNISTSLNSEDPAELQQQLQAAIEALNTASQAMEQGSNSLGNASQVEAALDQLSSGNDSAAAHSDTLSDLQAQADSLAKNVQSYTAQVDQACDTSTQLSGQAAAFQKQPPALSEGIQQFTAYLSAMQSQTGLLASSAPALSENVQKLTASGNALQKEGTAIISQGSSALAKGISQLALGSTKLQDGTGQLQAKLPLLTFGSVQLQDGIDTLKNGTGTLTAGMETLASNSSALLSGSKELTDGASKIHSGSDALYKGSSQLQDGISQLQDGTGTLQTALADGASAIKETNTSDSTADMFAAPVMTEETQITTVANNGHGMAPYMMSVALWVGCIAFSLVYPLTSYKGELKSGLSWWASKASVLYPIALLQAVVMIGALCLFDGFAPQEMGKTLLTACLASLAFMSIMYFFTNLLGKVGSFLMLVFMVIQLAGSVGTYPLELSGSFVPMLHDWVPFTYTVTAFRSTISGGESIRGSLTLLLVLFLIFTLLTVIEFQIRAKRIQNGKKTLMELIKGQGL